MAERERVINWQVEEGPSQVDLRLGLSTWSSTQICAIIWTDSDGTSQWVSRIGTSILDALPST